MTSSWIKKLHRPVDISSIVFFRIAFGAIMIWEVWRYFANGRIERYFIAPDFNFKYFGFEWITPLPDVGVYFHFLLLAVLGAFILLGFKYRISTVLFFIFFTYFYLMEQAVYLNHLYLVCLVSFLLIFIPAHRWISIDSARDGDLRSQVAPSWALWILRFQIGIVYFYGGIAKLNMDWLQGEPMRMWLASRINTPLIGSLFTHEWFVYFFSYSGLFIDLLAVPLLLYKKTRVAMFGVLVLFHLVNALLFSIGIFPWFMIAATTIFFAPEWPKKILGFVGVICQRVDISTPEALKLTKGQIVKIAVLAVFVVIQFLIPLRHHLYPGNVSWTEEGHNFSWHMKLRDKSADAYFTVIDMDTSEVWTIDNQEFLASWQEGDMEGRPDMILQFAHFLKKIWNERGYANVAVRANVRASLNGRFRQDLIDSSVDLAAEQRSLLPKTWIVPLKEKLHPFTGDK